MPADGHSSLLTRSPIHEAERAFANMACSVPGVLSYDADEDINRMAGIADNIVRLSRSAWTNRPKSDTGSCAEYVPVLIAKEIAGLISERLGLSDEAAALLDVQVERAAG